jgi:hypothetical protein
MNLNGSDLYCRINLGVFFPCNNLGELVKTTRLIDLRAFVGQLQQHHCPLKINLSHMLLNVCLCHHFFHRLEMGDMLSKLFYFNKEVNSGS